MATIKSYTDINQSKVLATILPLESADVSYLSEESIVPKVNYNGMVFFNSEEEKPSTLIPCWSLAALMNMLPSEFTEKGKYSETTYKIDIRKYALTDDVDIYQIAYGNYKFYENGNSSWKDMISTSQKENLLDVTFEMILMLNELKLL